MSTSTTSQNAEIAVLQTQMAEMQRSSTRVETKVDAMQAKLDTIFDALDGRYVTHTEHDVLKNDLTSFKRQYLLTHLLTATLTATLTTMIGYFLLNVLGHIK